MTTLQEVIHEARSYIMSAVRDEVTTLSANIISESPTTFTVSTVPVGLQAGARVSIGLETIYVQSISTLTVTGIRGWEGSAAGVHALGDVVYINPKITGYEYMRAVNNELRHLSTPTAGLFRASPVELTYNPATTGYNLTGLTAIDQVAAVYAQQSDGSNNWVPINRRDWELQRNAETDDFSTGFNLRLLSGAYESGRQVRVVGKLPFTSVTTLTTNVESVSGLPATCIDILAIGAALRLAGVREIARNLYEDGGMIGAGDEVPAGAANQAPAGLRQLYRDRLEAEKARLVRQYGLS